MPIAWMVIGGSVAALGLIGIMVAFPPLTLVIVPLAAVVIFIAVNG